MRKIASLSEYVNKRNGVPLGAKRSLRNMLFRSFGASSFAIFWNYWNPIWNYYLTRNILRPFAKFTPIWFAVPVTFVVSGFLHDLAISIFKLQSFIFFTPWFGLMGTFVVLTEKFSISYGSYNWFVRAFANSFFIVTSFGIVHFVNGY